jgi:hypothetical protein
MTAGDNIFSPQQDRTAPMNEAMTARGAAESRASSAPFDEPKITVHKQ